MKCYICLTDSIVNRKDYFNMLKVTLISARKNTSLRLICLYDGKIGDPVYNLLKDFKVEIIIHELPYKKELMEIYSHEWMETELGKDIEYSRIFGTFMRMEIPIIEKEDEYVLYTDMDIIFNDDILLKDLPHPAYLAAAPEFERDTKRMSYFNAGILVMNIQGMRIKYQQFVEMMKRRQRSTSGLFDQGYLNELCFKDMEILPIEYNWKPYWGINGNAKLIHFHGMKPCSNLEEAGFDTRESFFRTIFDNNSQGYAGYIYYFILFFNYLGQKQDQWLCYHLQYILDLYKKPLIALAQKTDYKPKYRKYKRLYSIFVSISILLAILLLTALFLV